MIPRTLNKYIAVCGLFLMAATALHACASSPTSPAEAEFSTSPPGQIIKVDGVLTSEGAECPAMRADGGGVYTLLGDLKGFRSGDRVRVEGMRQEISTCMQGITLQVTQITRR
jgi:hypothetical protein